MELRFEGWWREDERMSGAGMECVVRGAANSRGLRTSLIGSN